MEKPTGKFQLIKLLANFNFSVSCRFENAECGIKIAIYLLIIVHLFSEAKGGKESSRKREDKEKSKSRPHTPRPASARSGTGTSWCRAICRGHFAMTNLSAVKTVALRRFNVQSCFF